MPQTRLVTVALRSFTFLLIKITPILLWRIFGRPGDWYGRSSRKELELQHERDVLQEKMSEQSLKISSLQTKLDEQRLRAEELHRQGTSQLTVKVHDLQNELHNLKETLQTRDKQIVNLKQFLENSQQAIARQEKELAMNQDGAERSQHEQRLEAELKAKEEEIRVLKERIKNEMINKAALPDLMETILADKNEEIDQLKERLAQYQQVATNQADANQRNDGGALAKDDDGGRTLSDVVSITDCDESDMVMRRMPEQNALGGILPAHSIPMVSTRARTQHGNNARLFGRHCGANRTDCLMFILTHSCFEFFLLFC
uniref:Uncharacterized protein n=1 Tax=Anopheles maculatus TaxID=74869 RepID=A0A182SLL1_9DIPT